MPRTMGTYTAGLTAGTEVSSTYEGRHLTVLESELIHPFRVSDLVEKGDPVIVALTNPTRPHVAHGQAVGVALNSATAVGDLIAVDTEGIFNLNVNADDDGANANVNPGDALYISDDSSGTDDSSHNGIGDAVLSKITNEALQTPFGYALGFIGNGAFGVIAVKVHFDPLSPVVYEGDKRWNGDIAANYMLWDSAVSTFNIVNTTVPIGDRALDVRATQTDPNSEGLSAYFEGTINGNQANVLYNVSSWINVQTGHVGNQWISPYEGGLSCSAAAGGNLHNVAYGAIYGFFADTKPTMLFVWRINTQPGIGAIDAMIHAANADSIGWVPQGTETSNSLGVVPLAYIVGTAAVPGYVRLYADNL